MSTPIGNLEDITIRALKILNEATLILCEDTRKTRQLFALLGVQSSSSSKENKGCLAYHSHNFYEQRETLRDRIVRNEDEEVIALVSDAGAPVVSDPGQDLVDLVLEATSKRRAVAAAAERKSVVVPIPGASAVTTAVIGSGFKCDDGYRFCGFLPAKKNERVKVFREFNVRDEFVGVLRVSAQVGKNVRRRRGGVLQIASSARVCRSRTHQATRRVLSGHVRRVFGRILQRRPSERRDYVARRKLRLSASTKKTFATKVAPKDINDDDDTNDDDDESDKNTAKVLLEKTLRHLLLERAENQRLSVSEAAGK